MKIFRTIHDFLVDKSRLDLELNWITKVWYIILLIVFSIIVICNFCDIMNAAIFKEIKGISVVFVFWLFLLLLPLFESFEGFGVRMKRNKEDHGQLSEKITNMTDGLIDKKIQPMSPAQIENELNRD